MYRHGASTRVPYVPYDTTARISRATEDRNRTTIPASAKLYDYDTFTRPPKYMYGMSTGTRYMCCLVLVPVQSTVVSPRGFEEPEPPDGTTTGCAVDITANSQQGTSPIRLEKINRAD